MVALFIVFAVGTPMVALTLSYLVLFKDGAKKTGRWGVRRHKVHVGASPYRAGDSTKELPQGAPLALRIVCWLTAMGGVATCALLAPGGLLLVFVVGDQGHAVICLLVLSVSLSGFAAGESLVRVARQVTRHEAVGAHAFRNLYVHHAAVALTMILVDLVSGRLEVAVFSVVVCLAMVSFIMAVHSAAEVRVTRAGERTESA